MLKHISRFILIICLIFLCNAILVKSAFAHDASLTYTAINITDGLVDLTMTTPSNNILGKLKDEGKTINDIDINSFQDTFSKGFILENNGEKCNSKLIDIQKVSDLKSINYHFQFRCNNPFDKLHFFYHLFFDISPTHENITDVRADDYGRQIIFSSTNQNLDLDYSSLKFQKNTFNFLNNIFNFLRIGIMHILTGYDHILFLLGLLIITKKFRNLLKIISAFTVAHSITLSIATLGLFVLPARFTESMIALSIAYVAFENIKTLSTSKKKKWEWLDKIFINPSRRWIIAFSFGLIHGFGFYSALEELGIGKTGNVIVSLVSFNLGVEIGQLMIVGLMFPFLWYLRKQVWEVRAVKLVSIVIGLLGMFWFFQRLFT